MRCRLLWCFLVLVGMVAPVHAQRESSAETVSHAMIGDVLGDLSCRFSVNGEKYQIEHKNQKFTLVRMANGNRLQLEGVIAKQPSAAALSSYNNNVSAKGLASGWALARTGQGVAYVATVDCQLGVTNAGLRNYINRFAGDLASFESFLSSHKSAGVAKDDPPIGSGPGKIVQPPVLSEKRKPPLAIAQDSDDKEFVITFPTNDSKNWETAWKVIWDVETGKQANDQGIKISGGGSYKLFKIKKAFFKPGQKAEWIQVLEDAHPQEFYVPYYFRGTRFYDLGVGGYVNLSPKEGGAVSQVLSSTKKVIAELRDTGPTYKHGSITRRGEELTLFANFGASNYTYMIEYGFRDDGGVVFRHAPTGYNFFPHFDASHMHGSYWRVGMKLGPEGNNETNQVYTVRLPSNPEDQGDGGKLFVDEITKESFVDWNPREFTRIRVTNPNYSIIPPAKGRPNLPISYDLVTYPQGIARHERFKDEKFTSHDFWITRHDAPQKVYIHLGNYFFMGGGQVSPKLLPLEKQNVVIWHSSSGLHTPRAEDGIIGGNSSANGQATIYWTTFELRPRNLFMRTPIYRSLP